MTVGELRRFLSVCSDEMPVLIYGSTGIRMYGARARRVLMVPAGGGLAGLAWAESAGPVPEIAQGIVIECE